MIKKIVSVLGGVCAAVAMASPALAAYPERPITIIVPFAAGGATDILARQLGKELSVSLNTSVVIENRAGAGGTVGSRLAARATPDGYTLLMGTNASHAIAATISSALPYDPISDFEPISLVAHVPQVLMVHPSIPVNNISELIAYSTANPDSLNFGSAGNGTPGHLGMELFKLQSGADMVHVPFQGGAPALIALAGGQVQVLADNVSSALPQIKGERARAIAVTSSTRSSALPDMETIAEQGVTDFESGSWFALFAPAGTPAEIIERLNQETIRALDEPAVRQTLVEQGAEPAAGSPSELTELIKSDIAKWGEVVQKIGLQMN